MSRFALVCCFVALGCHDTPSARDRALAHLPTVTKFIAVADGSSLSAVNVRKAIAAARAFVPPSLTCVVDAALAADAISLGEDDHGIAIVIVGGTVPTCTALSVIAPGIAVATIGAPQFAAADASHAIDDPKWDRARSYLLHSPIATAIDLGNHHVLAAVQTDPLELWLPIDSTGAPPDLIPFVKQQPFADKLTITRVEHQTTLRATKLTDADLAALVTAMIVAVEQ